MVQQEQGNLSEKKRVPLPLPVTTVQHGNPTAVSLSLESEKSLFKRQMESIFVHFKLCDAHHLFLLTEKKIMLEINVSLKVKKKRYTYKVLLLQ